MNSFRYQAIEGSGTAVNGVVEAADRKTALQLLGERGLFPSSLEVAAAGVAVAAEPETREGQTPGFRIGQGVKRKEITAFTQEMGALLAAAIPIPQALDGLGEGEDNPVLKSVVLRLSESVRKGTALSAALEEHPQLFSKLYVSMVRVGEEAGVLPKVMADLALLLEHEDEVRGEVVSAVAYPVFVLCFGIFTVTILMTVVLPKLFTMLQEMLTVLPLPTLVLLKVSGFLHRDWFWVLAGVAGIAGGLWWCLRTPKGAEAWDGLKLRLPVLGAVFRSAAFRCCPR
jgi:type II secretory pathway component PulF